MLPKERNLILVESKRFSLLQGDLQWDNADRGTSPLDEYAPNVEDPFNLDLEDALSETGRRSLAGPLSE